MEWKRNLFTPLLERRKESREPVVVSSLKLDGYKNGFIKAVDVLD
jgi:hypothetical protein